MLPLAGEALTYRGATNASFVISAMIIVPQILVVLAAPWVGREAQSWGRRPLLLIGFGALTVRGLLFALTSNPLLLVPIQLLDGVSGSTLGVLTALIIADLTKGTGRFNLAQGFVGTLSGSARRSAPPSYVWWPNILAGRSGSSALLPSR
jgi:MFS family permease